MPWGAAIGAVGALGAAAINSSNKPSAGGSSTSQSPQTVSATDQALTTAQNISNTPYTPYTGAVVAPESANQIQGTAQASPTSALNTQAANDYTQAATDINNGSQQYNSANLNQYMDPYVQATLTPALNAENINFAQQKSALENSQAGAFGGDRSALQEQSLDTSHAQTIAGDVGNAYSNAFVNAQNAFFTNQKNQQQAGEDLANVGNDVSQLNTSQIQNLMATGGVQQALSQQQLNFNLNTFLTNQQWSTTQLQPLLQAIAASKGVQTNTSLYGPPSNVAGTAIGAASTVAGAYFTGGAPSSSSVNSTQEDAANYAIGDTTPGQLTPYGQDTPTTANYDSSDTDWLTSSDQRLKTDIIQIGHLPSGLPWYEFRYIYDQGKVHQGVLAQDVLPVFPEAVRIGEDGFLRVIYSRIH